MQMLSRRLVLNLTKNVLQNSSKQGMLATSSAAVMRNNVAAQQQQQQPIALQYSTARPQQKLLRFPAFPLEETIAKFLKSTEPHLTKEEYEVTKKAAEEFVRGKGGELQKLLEKVAAKEENWLAPRWLKVGYMQYRDPVTVFSSPGHVFPLVKFASNEEYLQYTGKWIYGLAKYKQMIDAGEMPIQKMGPNELDNSQFEKVLGTCRIPMPNEDTLEYNPKSKHAVVIFKNHFYKLPVYNNKGEALHPEVFAGELDKIVDSEMDKGTDFGILTTDNRDNWAEARVELLKPSGNKQTLEVIQQALFTVSLDDIVPAASGEELNVQGLQLIHGGGANQNSANRWMDKTIQLVVNRNGMSGFTYEHSPAEGQPIALMCDYVLKNLANEKHYEGAARAGYDFPQKLKLTKPESLDKWLKKARENANKLAKDLQMNVLHYKGFGKEFLKKQKMSPDSFIQMAIQLAFYRLHQVPGPHYESAHLRIYVGGRTETIRSCSNESVAFAKAMADSKVADEKKVELLRLAVNGHSSYTKMALQGRGVDRHLLGLKLMAVENSLPVPELYQSPGYVKSTNYRISTSQVASAYTAFMCYGPLTYDGYSCCYNPRPNDMILAMGAWKSNTVTDCKRFAVSMRESLDLLHDLLSRAGEKPTAKL